MDTGLVTIVRSGNTSTANGSSSPPQPKLNKASVEIVVGNTKKLKMKNLSPKKKVKWNSNRKSVAIVSSLGKVTALKKGTSKITATIADRKYICMVTVKAAKLNIRKKTLYVDDKVALKITNSSGKVSWSSGQPSIANVSPSGVVTAKEAGTAVISAKIGSSSYTCTITVKNRSNGNNGNNDNNSNAQAGEIVFATTDGGAFIQGASTANIIFNMNADTYATICIVNAVDEVVYDTSMAVKKGKNYTVKWSPDASAAEGTYHVRIKAGESVSKSDSSLTLHTNEFAGGTGSSKNPFQINSFQQFKLLPKYNGCYFRQTENIDCGNETYAGMFSESTPFTGAYDGNGKILSNLFLSNPDNDQTALFYSIGEKGIVKNLKLNKIYTTGTKIAALLCVKNSGKIIQCTLNDCHVVSSVAGKDSDAGILVQNNGRGATISGCMITNSTIAASYGWYHGWTGGIVGKNYGNVTDCTIENSKVTTTSTTYGWAHGSGLIAYNEGNMLNCTANEVTLESSSGNCDWSGGICAENKGVISKCSFLSGSAKNTGVYTNNGTFIE